MKQSIGPTAYRARSFFPFLFAGGMLLGPLSTGAGAVVVMDPPPTVTACVVVANGRAPGTAFTVSVSDPRRPTQTLSIPAGGCASTTVSFYSEVTLTQIAPVARTAIAVDPPDRMVSAQPRAAKVTVKTGDFADKVGVTFKNDCKGGNGFGDSIHCRG